MSLISDLRLLGSKSHETLAKLGGIKGLANKLNTNFKKGLLDGDISRQSELFGINELPEPDANSWFDLLWESFEDETVIVLMIAAVVSLVIGVYENPSHGWIEGTTILVAVLIVVVVTACNNYEKESQFRQLSAKEKNIDVLVLRGGEKKHVSVYDIVVGDIVCLELGDKVPADGIFLEGSNCSCD